MRTLIKNGRVIDPVNGIDRLLDILIEDDVIANVSENIELSDFDTLKDNIIDATDCLVMPGFVDLNAHVGEPGYEYRETIRTAARAAARGGYTSVCVRPDTRPVCDSVDMVEELKRKSSEITDINIYPVAAMTAGQDGEYITDIEGLKQAGAVAVSNIGKTIKNARVQRQAMKLAAECEMPVFDYCDDEDIRARGVMNAGDAAKELDLYGIMAAAEEVIIARDIVLAKNTGVKLHILNASTLDGVTMIDAVRQLGVNITCDVAPHNFALDEDSVVPENADFKLNPPLRSRADVDGLVNGLRTGVIDGISTQHFPVNKSEKAKDFNEAPFGASGLEVSASVAYTYLVDKGVISVSDMAKLLSTNPASIAGINAGKLSVGEKADLVVFDANKEYVLDSSKFASMGKNTPFNGMTLKGQVKYTCVSGKIVYSNVNGTEIIVDKDVPKL